MAALPRVTLDSAHPLLLASASPRRRELLERAGVPLRLLAVDVDEAVASGETPATYLARVVDAKLAAAAARRAEVDGPFAAILVADTSVIRDDEILGKPASPEHAEEMLASLAGRRHEVHTRFAIGDPVGACVYAETVKTTVSMRPLGPRARARYVATGEGRDKAGAYAIQGVGAGLVTRVEGSYTNVVGLPLAEVVMAFEQLGLL